MTKQSPRIIYMGTPGFAVAPLRMLLESGYNVVGVITAPDRRAGRGKKISHSEVKSYILSQEKPIPVLQPENLKDPAFIEELRALKPDLQIVVAFRMLPELVWSIPFMGTFNLHASLLPHSRGAAPINHVLMNGDKETGVTTFLIDEKIDTGKILLQKRIAIGDEETAGELHDRLMDLGASLVLETVQQLSSAQLEALSQDQYMDAASGLNLAPKIFKEDCRIDWDLPGEKLFNLIRGLSPYPGAFTMLKREDGDLAKAGDALQCKVFKVNKEEVSHQELPGCIFTDGKRALKVAVRDGWIHVHSIQQEGKRRMEIKDFLAGFSFENGIYLFF
jgi:methionyl-tRNA formyltransferase